MPRSRFHHQAPLSMNGILLLLLLFPGCAIQGATVLEDKEPRMESIVVAGFIPVLSGDEEAGVVHGPLHGTVYMANPVPREVAEKLTENVYAKIAEKGYEVISPDQAKGVLGTIISSKPDGNGIQLYRELGKAFSADGVLVGYLYRWLERQGTNYAVERPASVAFDLYLLRTEDGAVVWRGKFDKTQQSFFENLLDIGAFMKSKGQWVKAEVLAEMGLNELLGKFPKSIRRSEKE